MELNIFFKIIIKFGIISSFIILGIRLHYISEPTYEKLEENGLS